MPNPDPGRGELARSITDFIRDPRPEGLESLALAAAKFQRRESAPLQRLWQAQDGPSTDAVSINDIPALPTLAFKNLDVGIDEPEVEFVSSGTSGQLSRHPQAFLDLYRTVIEASFSRAFPTLERPGILALVPDIETARQSSLAFMVDHLVNRQGSERSSYTWGERGLQLGRLRSWLAGSQRLGAPVVILATSQALIQTLERLAKINLRFRLSPGSVVIHTGGTKTSEVEIDPSRLAAMVTEHLGLAPDALTEEYGMTELTSHFYGRRLAGDPDGGVAFDAPPWTRVRVVDPATLDEVATGEVGLISVLDLANLSTSIHVLTQDLGVSLGGGRFRLVGRAEGAELRGCSLLTEQLSDAR